MQAAEHILLLEADEAVARVLTVLLQRWGYRVEAVSDDLDALRAVDRERPDIIVADVGLPERLGLNLARVLKADLATHAVPIIGIEAEGDAAEQAAIDAGCLACFRFPLDTHRLQGLLRIVLQG